MTKRLLYYTDTPFDKLPKGIPKDVLHLIMLEFKSGDFKHRDMYILAHTRLATVIALQYGYRWHFSDELIDVALIELCQFPERVAKGSLKDERMTSYLLSRLHTVCRDFVRSNSSLVVPHSSIIRRGKKKVKRVELPNDKNITESDKYYITGAVNNDFVNDLKSCVSTSRESIVLDMTLSGCTDREITKAFGLRSQTVIKDIKNTLFARYRSRDKLHVQTFLPYPDFTESAQCLDMKRLGKQRVECKQLLLNQFPNHPVAKMWRGYEFALCTYAIEIAGEWLERGYNDTTLEWFAERRKEYVDTGLPKWLGRKDLHDSHKSNLLRKDENHYIQFNWGVPNNLPYIWPN